MFYSHNFLAKKGPLGTVWIAAHLQHKLKKSKVATVDISSSVDCIMYPEVPIALRLSGHLLVGVVRIYSKKVEYLYHDCNTALTQIRRMVSSVHVLPEGANRATFEAVTLPDKFRLDAFELDDAVYETENLDNHVKAREEITLQDQIPAEGEQYVAFSISEERIEPSPDPELLADLGIAPMEVDAHPSFPVESDLDRNDTLMENNVGIKDHGLSIQAETDIQNEDNIIQDLPEREIGRDVRLEPWDPAIDNVGPYESSDQMKGMASLSPIREHLSYSGEVSLPLPSHPKETHVASVEDIENFNRRGFLEQPSPGLALQSSQPVGKQKAKSRKRKMFYDESIILSNAEMKEQLNNTTKLKHRRVKLPCTSLSAWKFQKRREGEQLFHEPLLSGMCNQIVETSKKTFPAIVVDSIPLEAPVEGAPVPATFPEMVTEIERPRFDGHLDAQLPESMPSPSGWGSFSPVHPSNLGSVSQTRKHLEVDVSPTIEIPTVAEPVVFRHETPTVRLEENLDIDDLHSAEIQDLANTPKVNNLEFLEADATPTGSETNEIDNMSVRTRAVARYLKGQSPVSGLSDNQAESLSLNQILEGKTRKRSARMFFETLVLKSCGYIDVQQEEPYGDIAVILNSTFSGLKL